MNPKNQWEALKQSMQKTTTSRIMPDDRIVLDRSGTPVTVSIDTLKEFLSRME